ncbi:unnamed protein product [Prunus armeniaca]
MSYHISSLEALFLSTERLLQASSSLAISSGATAMVASYGGCSGRGYGDYSRVASCGGRVFGDHGSFSPSRSEFSLGRSFSGTPNRSTSAASWQYFWAWSYWATAIWLYSFSFGPPYTRGPI